MNEQLTVQPTEIKWRDFQPVDDDGFSTDYDYSLIHAFVPNDEGEGEEPSNVTLCGAHVLWDDDCKPLPFAQVESGFFIGNTRCEICERLAKEQPFNAI